MRSQPAPGSPPADVCINNQTASTRTGPFTAAALGRQGAIFFPRKGRGSAGAGRCGDAPKGSRTTSGTGLLCRIRSRLSETQKHTLRCLFSCMFNHFLNSVLAPVSARLQPSGNRPALIHAEGGLLSLGRCRSAGEVTLLQFAVQMRSCHDINLFPIQFR